MNGKRPLQPEEYESIHDYLIRHKRWRDLAMVSLCYHTGYRIKEILSITVKELLNPSGEFRQQLYIAPRKMKKKAPRMPIPLRDQLKKDLSYWLKELRSTGQFHSEYYLIQSQKGSNKAISYTQAYRIITDLFDACDIYDNVAVHSFRKSFCENIFEHSKNIVFTQNIMGHSTVDTTLKYIRVNQDKLNQIILES